VSNYLLNILWYVILLDLFAMVVMIVFLINARINLARQITSVRFYYRVIEVTTKTGTSSEAAELLGMSIDHYTTYCRMKGIETPEDRVEKKKRIERERQEQEQRIMDEEAEWRAEQERIVDERRKAQEMDTRKRKERLKKFGLR